MPRLLHLGNRTAIYIEDTAFAGGGEGDIYRIIQPAKYRHQVVKLYKPAKRTAERVQKMAHLIANPPFLLDAPRQQVPPLAWARELAYENGHFAGLMMPAVQGIKLEMLCQPKLPAALGTEWHRLALGQPEARILRLKLCYNIALAVSQLHRFGEYALIDLKADNILVQPNGTVVLIDTDSLAVFADDQLQFAAPVVTPDFAPPEYYQGSNPNTAAAAHAWDSFSLAVLFYRILCGIHPYTGTCAAPFEHLNDIGGKVAQGLFVQGKHRPMYAVIPPPHASFEQLPPHIRRLLLRCFDDGHLHPSYRPQPDEWHTALLIHLAQLPPDYPLPSKSIKILVPVSTVPPRLSATALERLTKESASLRVKTPPSAHADVWLARLGDLERQYHQTSIKWEARQAELLRREAKAFRQAIGAFRQRLLALDRQAARAYQTQLAEQRQISTELSSNIARLELPARQFRQTQLKTAEAPFEQQIASFVRQLEAIDVQEKTAVAALEVLYAPKLAATARAMTLLLNRHMHKLTTECNKQLRKIAAERGKLQKKAQKELDQLGKTWLRDYVWQQMVNYRIADYAHSIFGNVIAQPRDMAVLLAQYGVMTAADFDTIMPSGGVKVRATGKTVRVRGLGGTRGGNLRRWQQRIKETLTTQIRQNWAQYAPIAPIQRQYAELYRQLDSRTEAIQIQTEREKQTIEQHIQPQKQKIMRQEQQIQQQIKQKLTTLQGDFQRYRQPLAAQIADIQQQCRQATQHLWAMLEKMERDAAQQWQQLTRQADEQKQSIALYHELASQKTIAAETEQWRRELSTIQQQTTQTLAQYARQTEAEWQAIAQKITALQGEWRGKLHKITYR